MSFSFGCNKAAVQKDDERKLQRYKPIIHFYNVFLNGRGAIENILCNIIMDFPFNQIELVFVAIYYF